MASISESLIQGLLQPSLNFQNLQEPLGMLLGGAQAKREQEEKLSTLMEQAASVTNQEGLKSLMGGLNGLAPEQQNRVMNIAQFGIQQSATEEEQKVKKQERKRAFANELEAESELIKLRMAAQNIARKQGNYGLARALGSATMSSIENFLQEHYKTQAPGSAPKPVVIPGTGGALMPNASGGWEFKQFGETEQAPSALDVPPDINQTEAKIISDSTAAASTARTRAAMVRRGLEVLSNRGNVRGPFATLRSKALGVFGNQDELSTAYQDVNSLFLDEALQAYLPRPGAISNYEAQWAAQQSKDPYKLNDSELNFFLNRKIEMEEAKARYNEDLVSHISKYGTNAGFNDIVLLRRSEQKLNELKKTEQYRILYKLKNDPNLDQRAEDQAIALVKKQRPDVAKYSDDLDAAIDEYNRYAENVDLFEKRFSNRVGK